jgi:integrase/recombinase XerC
LGLRKLEGSAKVDKDSISKLQQQGELLSAYDDWMISEHISNHSRRTYKSQVRAFLVFLAAENINVTTLSNSHEHREHLVRSYKADLQGWLKGSSINNAIIAVNHFFQFLGFKPVRLRRMLVHRFQRNLTPEEQERFLHSVEKCKSAKERALAKLIYFCGIKLGQLASLNLDDLKMTGNGLKLMLKKGDALEIERDSPVSEALHNWCLERGTKFPNTSDPALFLNRYGKRISTTGIDQILRKLGFFAHLEVTAEVLRRAYVARELLKEKENPLLCKPNTE